MTSKKGVDSHFHSHFLTHFPNSCQQKLTNVNISISVLFTRLCVTNINTMSVTLYWLLSMMNGPISYPQ